MSVHLSIQYLLTTKHWFSSSSTS